jgi:arginyl-tRNA synthetase
MVVGNLAINLLRATGHTVIAASYINDLGNNVAKCLWAMEKLHKGEMPEKGDEINFLGRMYTQATRESKDNKKAQAEISEIQKELENKKGAWHRLWKITRGWSINAIYKIFKEMELPLDVQYYESDLLEDTKKIVDELRSRGLAVESDGATIVDLEDEGLGANLLVKSDGSHLYNAKDLALAIRKNKDYDLDRSMIVVDERQSLAMKQLFATLKKMGVQMPYEHLSYAFVTLPEGAMSSRAGNFVLYSNLRDTLFDEAKKETEKRHSDWTKKNIEETAMLIARAAMIYSMARHDAGKDVVFDIKDAISFDGISGPYLLYSVSRIESLLKMSKIKPSFNASVIDSEYANCLVDELAKCPHVILESASTMKLSAVAQYAFELAQAFSAYYGAVRIIDTDDKCGTAARLSLVSATLIVLQNLLKIMNIQSVKQM